MAQFYASIKGNRGEATRMGTKNSGMHGHIRGWDIGCEVEMRYNEETGKDEVHIYLTSGSRGSGIDQLIGIWDEDNKLIARGNII